MRLTSSHTHFIVLIGCAAVTYLLGYATAIYTSQPIQNDDHFCVAPEKIRKISENKSLKRDKNASCRENKTKWSDRIGPETDGTNIFECASMNVNAFTRHPDGTVDIDIDALFRNADQIASLKQEDGEIYESVAIAIDEHISEVVDASESRISQLRAFDNVLKTEKAKVNHANLIEALHEIMELHRSMNSFDGRSSVEKDQRDGERCAQLADVLNEALSNERATLLYELTSELGYEGNDAQAIVTAIEGVFDATQPNPETDRPTKLNSVTLTPMADGALGSQPMDSAATVNSWMESNEGAESEIFGGAVGAGMGHKIEPNGAIRE